MNCDIGGCRKSLLAWGEQYKGPVISLKGSVF